MKKLLAVTFVVAWAPSILLAASDRVSESSRSNDFDHPMAGCGLGYVLFAHEDNSKPRQILGATVNGTSGNQTFGITSGTLGCTEDGAVKFAKEAEVFADVNLDSLRYEMAIGEGEYVNSFATLLGASETTRPTLVKFFQAEYTSLFPSSNTTSAQLLQVLEGKLAQHPELIG